MSQDKVNGLVPPDQEANTDALKQPTPSATTKTLEDLLTEVIRKARFEGWERGKEQADTPTDYTLSDETYPKQIFKEALAAINNYITQRVIEELEKLKQEMQMHTVPEGKHLITRSYLNNSIDFMVAELKGGIDG